MNNQKVLRSHIFNTVDALLVVPTFDESRVGVFVCWDRFLATGVVERLVGIFIGEGFASGFVVDFVVVSPWTKR